MSKIKDPKTNRTITTSEHRYRAAEGRLEGLRESAELWEGRGHALEGKYILFN